MFKRSWIFDWTWIFKRRCFFVALGLCSDISSIRFTNRFADLCAVSSSEYESVHNELSPNKGDAQNRRPEQTPRTYAQNNGKKIAIKPS